MCKQIFCPRENPHIARQPLETLAADLLHADALDKIRGRQPSAPARPAASGQNVVAATRIIAQRLRAPRTEKNGSGSRNLFESRSPALRKAQMFRRKAVHEVQRRIAPL